MLSIDEELAYINESASSESDAVMPRTIVCFTQARRVTFPYAYHQNLV